MRTIDQVQALSESVDDLVRSGAITRGAVVNPGAAGGAEQAQWKGLLQRAVADWGTNQQGHDKDGVEWPNSVALNLAYALAMALQQEGICPPTRVVPSGEGGMVFEHQCGQVLHTFEIEADGSIEFCRFDDAKLAVRTRIPSASTVSE